MKMRYPTAAAQIPEPAEGLPLFLKRISSYIERMNRDEFHPCGLFAPDSMTWRINRESVILLGGVRALLMQVAHPAVAQGVYDHSNFQNEPLGRLYRTLQRTLKLVYGSRDEALEAAGSINRVHDAVRGDILDVQNPPQSYYAQDPRLLLWVFATLIDSALAMHDHIFGDLTPGEKNKFYEENKTCARLLGVPESILPIDYPAFREYVQSCYQNDEVAVNSVGQTLAHAILYPRIFVKPDALLSPARILSIGLLPRNLRQQYGFEWSVKRERYFEFLIRSISITVRILPPVFRRLPQYYVARRRWRKLAAD